MGKALRDISGQRFGKLTAISPVRSNGVTFWNCRCDCGNMVVARLNNLRQGLTQSCGCARIKKYQSKAEKTEAEKKAVEEREKAAEERERRQDLTGKRFGHLIVLAKAENPNGGVGTFWLCRCDCGNEVSFSRRELVKRNIRSCGCRKKKPLQLTGQRFGKLLVLGKNEDKSKAAGRSVWNCVCDCGTHVAVRGEVLQNGYKKSCGCARRGRPRKKIIDPEFLEYHACRDCADRKKCDMTNCKYEGDFCDESNH